MANLLHTTTIRAIRDTVLRSSKIYKSSAIELQRNTVPLAQTAAGERSLDIMFFVQKHNSLSQRVAQELTEKNHQISVHEISNSDEMKTLTTKKTPDLILCPFLTKRVPHEVYMNPVTPCLIVHPGIEGDRGMTSIDWALKENAGSWGVTVMQADKVMDAGDIWSTRNFQINRPNINSLTKSSLYVNEVTNAAVEACLQAVDNFLNNIAPRSLDYAKAHVHGRLRPTMKKSDRQIDWEQPAEDVARQVRMSDSSPGAMASVKQSNGESKWSDKMRVFGAHIEELGLENSKGAPGEVLGQRDDAILVKCGEGSVWLSHLKKDKLKLPATSWLKNMDIPQLPAPSVEVPHGMFPKTFQEIWTTVSPRGVCHVNFDFYNGAMSTGQCRRLDYVLSEVGKDERVKVIVLKGGLNFFSNGIHLNVIESCQDPSEESWRNINAINDVVQRIFMSDKVTISAVRGNAGAGGAMVALASDFTLAREGVVFNPHYRTMHLFGSEYHTYFLPNKVGKAKAEQLLNNAVPMLSNEAVRIGFVDGACGRTHQDFEAFVEDVANNVASPSIMKEVLKSKERNKTSQWLNSLQKHRAHELEKMASNFQSNDYHQARKSFVYH